MKEGLFSNCRFIFCSDWKQNGRRCLYLGMDLRKIESYDCSYNSVSAAKYIAMLINSVNLISIEILLK